MRAVDVRAYLDRDWAAIRASKDRYWIERKRRLGPAEGIRMADELRRHVLALRPGWPGPRERAEDLESHVRLSELLRRAAPIRGR